MVSHSLVTIHSYRRHWVDNQFYGSLIRMTWFKKKTLLPQLVLDSIRINSNLRNYLKMWEEFTSSLTQSNGCMSFCLRISCLPTAFHVLLPSISSEIWVSAESFCGREKQIHSTGISKLILIARNINEQE